MKISIIVPVYKVESYLDRCVKSLIGQTYQNLEILLIDDGSPDKCPEMCDQYAKIDPRIVSIHKKNGGLSSARNAGLDVATGDFVLFVDSDDYVETDLCQILADSVKENCDIYAFRFRRFFDEKQGDPHKGDGSVRYFYGRDIFEMYINREPFTHMVCDKMFRLGLFDGLRFIEGRLAEDLAICFQLFGRAGAAASIDRTLYNYYTREDSIMGSGSLKLCLDTYKGECEAHAYCKGNYPEYCRSNDIRFLNQSMKTCLKLLMRYGKNPKDPEVKDVMDIINMIDMKGMPLSTVLFYRLFKFSKVLSWQAFRILKLS